MEIAIYILISFAALVMAVAKSPKAKRHLGTWLIASADADDTRKEYFEGRLSKLRSDFCGSVDSHAHFAGEQATAVAPRR